MDIKYYKPLPVDVRVVLNWSFPNTDLDLWVAEAVALRSQIYDIEGKDNLSYKYAYKNWDTVKGQLYKGGIRLAEILNEIYD